MLRWDVYDFFLSQICMILACCKLSFIIACPDHLRIFERRVRTPREAMVGRLDLGNSHIRRYKNTRPVFLGKITTTDISYLHSRHALFGNPYISVAAKTTHEEIDPRLMLHESNPIHFFKKRLCVQYLSLSCAFGFSKTT